MSGMSGINGAALDELAHIRQSIGDILTTPLGTRVMRREYGSLVPYLVDAPIDAPTVLEIIQATARAIGRWEPRVRVLRVGVDDSVPPAGRLTISLDLAVIGRVGRVSLDIGIGSGHSPSDHPARPAVHDDGSALIQTATSIPGLAIPGYAIPGA